VWDDFRHPSGNETFVEPGEELLARHGIQFNAFAVPLAGLAVAPLHEERAFLHRGPTAAQVRTRIDAAVVLHLLALPRHGSRSLQAEAKVKELWRRAIAIAPGVALEGVQNLQAALVKVVGHQNGLPRLRERFYQLPGRRYRHALGTHDGHIIPLGDVGTL